MDLLISAAARALAAGDPLGALNRVALRDDAPALALRGIAMAQLGDLAKARELLRGAARAFGPRFAVARARCAVAEAEVALAARDLAWPARGLEAARATLEKHGDALNAAHARYIEARRQLLIGHLDRAEQLLGQIDPAPFPPALRAGRELALAGIAMRRLRATAAKAALGRARHAASQARIPALMAEIESAILALGAPAARLSMGGQTRLADTGEIEALLASGALAVDACRRVVCDAQQSVSLARRPVLFALARLLGAAWPADVPRDALIAHTFRARSIDESHRVRLRVEIGRLRAALRPLADVRATRQGYVLAPRAARQVAGLDWPVDTPHGAVLALLADGESWSSSALALALGASQRTVQRALDALAAADRARPYGSGRARRWAATPMPAFATSLLLPSPLFERLG